MTPGVCLWELDMVVFVSLRSGISGRPSACSFRVARAALSFWHMQPQGYAWYGIDFCSQLLSLRCGTLGLNRPPSLQALP